MNTKTDKVTQSALALSLTSSNPSEYPLIYSDDSWCLVQTGSSLATIMGQTGTATQSEINEKLAKNAGAGAGVVDQVEANTNAIKGIIDTSLKRIDNSIGLIDSSIKLLDPSLFQEQYRNQIVNMIIGNAYDISTLRRDASNSYVLTSTYNTKIQALDNKDASLTDMITNVDSSLTYRISQIDSSIKLLDPSLFQEQYRNQIVKMITGNVYDISTLRGDVSTNYYTKSVIDTSFQDASTYNDNTYLKDADFSSWKTNTYTPFTTQVINDISTNKADISTNKTDIENLSSNLTSTKNTLSNAINDVSTLAKRNETNINGVLTGSTPAWGTLTKAQIDWIKKKMQDELSEEALKLYAVSTTGGATFNSDETAAASMTSVVTVTLTYNGTSQIKADATPSGWTENTLSSGKYTYTKTATTSASVPAATFKYTIPSSDPSYGGITVSRNSTAKSVSVVNPAYYGIVNVKSTATISTFIKNLTRITSRLNTTASIKNTTGSAGYLVIVTKSTATATQLGLSILDAATSGISFTSPKNSAITMSGYNVYFSTNSVAAGGSLENTLLTINL